MKLFKNQQQKKSKIVWIILFLLIIFYLVWRVIFINHYQNKAMDEIRDRVKFEHGTELDEELSAKVEANVLEVISHISFTEKKDRELYKRSKYSYFDEYLLLKIAHPIQFLFKTEKFEKQFWTEGQNVSYLDILNVLPRQKLPNILPETNYVLTIDDKDLEVIKKNRKQILAGTTIIRPKNFDTINIRDLGSSSFVTYLENPDDKKGRYTFIHVTEGEPESLQLQFRFLVRGIGIIGSDITKENTHKSMSIINLTDNEDLFQYMSNNYTNIYDWVQNYGQIHEVYGRKEINKVAINILKAIQNEDHESTYWQYYQDLTEHSNKLGHSESPYLSFSGVEFKSFGTNQQNYLIQSKTIDNIEISENFIVKKEKKYQESTEFVQIAKVSELGSAPISEIDLEKLVSESSIGQNFELDKNTYLQIVEINQNSYLKIDLLPRSFGATLARRHQDSGYIDLDTHQLIINKEWDEDSQKKQERNNHKNSSYLELLETTNLKEKNFINGIYLKAVSDFGVAVTITDVYFNELGKSKLAKRYPEISDQLAHTRQLPIQIYFKTETIESIIPLLIHQDREIFQDLVLKKEFSKNGQEQKIDSLEDFEKYSK